MDAQQFRDCCEAYIDSATLSDALQELANVCYTKADNLRAGVPNRMLAKTWDKAAERIESAARAPVVISAGQR